MRRRVVTPIVLLAFFLVASTTVVAAEEATLDRAVSTGSAERVSAGGLATLVTASAGVLEGASRSRVASVTFGAWSQGFGWSGGALVDAADGAAVSARQAQAVAGPPVLRPASARGWYSLFVSDASISGLVFHDVDGDGSQGGSEPGLEGQDVGLVGAGPDETLDTGDDVIFTDVTTDSSGDYSFTSLDAGLYRVEVRTVDQSGFSATTTHPIELTISESEAATASDTGLLFDGYSGVTLDVAPADVSTFAGSGTAGSDDGTGTDAEFGSMRDLVVVGDYAYVAENDTIRRVDLTTAEVTTFLGVDGSSSCTNSSTPSSVRFQSIKAMTTDGFNLYVADCTDAKTIRRVSLATGATSTLVTLGGLGTARDITYVPGVNLFVA
ncbi:MAG: hypothetical protein IH941_13480, partial [Acidobacteria bacterium]|nr:hypothetical protein [Acidobacteriota bacterium]